LSPVIKTTSEEAPHNAEGMSVQHPVSTKLGDLPGRPSDSHVGLRPDEPRASSKEDFITEALPGNTAVLAELTTPRDMQGLVGEKHGTSQPMNFKNAEKGRSICASFDLNYVTQKP
jgi:hypothetical protein